MIFTWRVLGRHDLFTEKNFSSLLLISLLFIYFNFLTLKCPYSSLHLQVRVIY